MTADDSRQAGAMPRPGGDLTSTPAAGTGAPDQPEWTPAVIGLDLAAERSGIALPDGTTGVIKAPRKAGKTRTLTDDLARLAYIADYVGVALDYHGGDLIVIEDYAPGIRSAAAHRLAEVSGVVRLTCHRAGAAIALVNVKYLKVYATGNGSAEKRDMALAAYKRAGLEFATDDECDAWWLRAMGLDYLGYPPMALPKLHRDALTKVSWPAITEPFRTGTPHA